LQDYHRKIQDAILKFGELHLGKEILSISKGGERLRITHRTKSIDPITFKPDGIFTLKNRTKMVFQVLGSQARKGREIEADIFRAYLYNGVSKLIFIVPSETDGENVSRITEIIQDGLDSLGISKDLRLFLTLVIPKKVRGSESALKYLNDRRVLAEVFAQN